MAFVVDWFFQNFWVWHFDSFGNCFKKFMCSIESSSSTNFFCERIIHFRLWIPYFLESQTLFNTFSILEEQNDSYIIWKKLCSWFALKMSLLTFFKKTVFFFHFSFLIRKIKIGFEYCFYLLLFQNPHFLQGSSQISEDIFSGAIFFKKIFVLFLSVLVFLWDRNMSGIKNEQLNLLFFHF